MKSTLYVFSSPLEMKYCFKVMLNIVIIKSLKVTPPSILHLALIRAIEYSFAKTIFLTPIAGLYGVRGFLSSFKNKTFSTMAIKLKGMVEYIRSFSNIPFCLCKVVPEPKYALSSNVPTKLTIPCASHIV